MYVLVYGGGFVLCDGLLFNCFRFLLSFGSLWGSDLSSIVWVIIALLVLADCWDLLIWECLSLFYVASLGFSMWFVTIFLVGKFLAFFPLLLDGGTWVYNVDRLFPYVGIFFLLGSCPGLWVGNLGDDGSFLFLLAQWCAFSLLDFLEICFGLWWLVGLDPLY